MKIRWFRRRPGAFARNRPILRSPVMARFDALFADPAANARVYPAAMELLSQRLTAETLRTVFAEHSPDDSLTGIAASSDDVVTHVFDHILGPDSWWGAEAADWRGEELLAAAYRDAIERAQAAGDVPISTFHLQASPDDRMQVHVLDAGRAIVVIIATPPVPGTIRDPRTYKAGDPTATRFLPRDDAMPEVSSYTAETLGA
jgi:hypothetical protein